MRNKTIAAIILLLTCYNTYSQDEQKSRTYELISNVAVTATNVRGTRIYAGDRFFIPPYRSKFAYIKFVGDSVLIRFLTWKSIDLLRKKFNKDQVPMNQLSSSFKTYLKQSRSLDTSDEKKVEVLKYFLMSREDFDSNTVNIFPTGFKSIVFTLGIVTMPIKLRLGKNFDFQGNLSLGTTAGVKMCLSKYSPNFVNFLLGASISTTTLDSFSTKGKIIGQPITNQAVFSPSLGIVFEFGRAQAGVFYGWDLLNKSTDSRYNWIYNNKPWISIGFGFSIFSINSTSQNTDGGTNTAAD